LFADENLRRSLRKSRFRNGVKKDSRVVLRVTAEEHSRLKELAKLEGISVARLVVTRALKSPERIEQDLDLGQILNELKRLTYEVNKIGSNINQIAYVANSTRSVSMSQVQGELNELDKLSTTVNSLTEQIALRLR
jgi:hypothetical protein